MNLKSLSLVLAGSVALAAIALSPIAKAAETFMLKSSAFEDNGLMPQKMAGANKANPNCTGENVSPALSWSNVPEGTKSLALLMVDPEGRAGLGVVHWVAYGIAPSTAGFAENETSAPSQKYIGGKGTQNQGIYLGPCPPKGSGFHHYTFTLIATDLEPTALQPGLTKDELVAALNGHSKGAAGLIGRFGQ
jgi:hypothetical protein